jgi:hypothetical protein
MRYIVHIGTEKTGSTSIQKFMHMNKPALADLGFLYLHNLGRVEYRDISAFCMKQGRVDDYFMQKRVNAPSLRAEFDKNFLSDFHRKMDAAVGHVHTVIISSEHFSSRLNSLEEIERLKQLLSGYASQVTIVCYIRDQVAKICSQYSTWIKGGGREKFGNYFSAYLRKNNHRDLYDSKFELWGGVFGYDNLRVRLFDESFFNGGTLLSDFSQQLPDGIDEYLTPPPQHKNQALSRMGCEWLRRLNYFFPERVLGYAVVKVFREWLIDTIALLTKGEGLQLSSEQKALVEKRFGQSNARTCKKYFPDREYLFTE